jgi:ERCC4-type nuclease
MSRSEADKERWVEASKEVVETIRLRRREAWREFVHTQLQYTQDPQKTARVIRNINREQRMGSNFTLFSPTGKRLDTDSEKANAFLNVFAKASSKDHSRDFRGPYSAAKKGQKACN